MKVILLKDVKKIGRKMDVKDVADGLALNRLIPMGLALQATAGNIKMVEEKNKNSLTDTKMIQEATAKALAGLKDGRLVIEGNTNEKGHLFAAIHLDEVGTLIKSKTNVELPSSYLTVAKPIKEAGDHEVTVTVGKETATFILKISAE